ncbi:hypothetical protein Tco_0180033 [Tanacetum coccineum]
MKGSHRQEVYDIERCEQTFHDEKQVPKSSNINIKNIIHNPSIYGLKLMKMMGKPKRKRHQGYKLVSIYKPRPPKDESTHKDNLDLESTDVPNHRWSSVVEWYALACRWYSLRNCGALCTAAELVFLAGLVLLAERLLLVLGSSDCWARSQIRSVFNGQRLVVLLLHASWLGLILCLLLPQDMVMHTIDTIASVLTQRELDHFCNTYNILADLGPELPGRKDTIRDALLFVLGAAKNWNDHFFWIDASICPISVPWHMGASILKDPFPFDDRVNAELLALLDHHRTDDESDGLRPSPPFLFIYVCLYSSNLLFAYMGLLDFVKSSNPLKVKTEERTLAEGEIPLNDETINMTVPPSAEIVCALVVVPTTSGKSLAALKRLELQSGPQGVGSSFVPPPVEEFVSSSVTPTPEHDAPEDSGSTQDGGVWTHRTSMGVVVSSSSGPDDEVAPPKVEDTATTFARGQTVETATTDNIYVPEWGVTNGARIDNPALCRNLYEHEIMTREKFQKKFTDNCAVVQQHNAEIVALKTRLEKAELEVAEVEGRVQEDAEACRFEQKSAELDARIADVRRDMDNDLYPHMFTVIAGRRWILSHSVRLAVMKCAQSVECQSALGKVITLAINKGIQEGLEVGIEHGKSGQTLAQVEAYDPGVKDDFVSVVTDFENVSFGLLDELESLKDSPLASIMSALVLKDTQGNVVSTLELQWFQPSLDQVTVPIYSESGSISGEVLLSKAIPTARAAAKRRGLCPRLVGGTSSSAPPHGLSLGIADYPVSTFVLSSDGEPTTHPHVTQAHDDLFDTFVLDGAGGA